MKVHYLEIVTDDVAAVCGSYESALGVKFNQKDEVLGGARTCCLADGSWVGVRGLLSETEEPVVRPYYLVDDIEAALSHAQACGAEVLHPPLELPDKGTFAIYRVGLVHHGLWQL